MGLYKRNQLSQRTCDESSMDRQPQCTDFNHALRQCPRKARIPEATMLFFLAFEEKNLPSILYYAGTVALKGNEYDRSMMACRRIASGSLQSSCCLLGYPPAMLLLPCPLLKLSKTRPTRTNAWVSKGGTNLQEVVGAHLWPRPP